MMNGRTALYRIYDDTDVLLYIGVSNHFGIRWQKHACVQPWWPQGRRQTIYWYDSRDEALDAEALAIFTEQPKHNVMHRKQAQRLRRLQGHTGPRRVKVQVPVKPPPLFVHTTVARGWLAPGYVIDDHET